jgi:serine/threonine protein kinase
MVIIGINSPDRPGLLNKISKCLTQMKLQCHRTEAAVIGLRSFSVWRCERLEREGNDLNEIWVSLKENLTAMRSPPILHVLESSKTTASGNTYPRKSSSTSTVSDDNIATNVSPTIPSSVDGIPLVRYPRYTLEFKMLSPLGKGGFGAVFRCQNVLDCREYAVKKISIKSFVDEWGVSTEHLSNTLRRVLREVKILALLDHPNIVRYYTAWLEMDDGFSALVDESLEDSYNSILTANYKKKYASQFLSTPRKGLIGKKFQQSDFSDPQYFMNAAPVETSEGLGFSWDKGEEIPEIPNRSEQYRAQDCDAKYPPIPSALLTQLYTLYIQMQLCSQRSLSDFIASTEKSKRGSLTMVQGKCGDQLSNSKIVYLPHALQVFSQIASGVKHVHAQGLIHRDLKPSNCFIDETGTVKIGDFGLSRESVKSGIEEMDDYGDGAHIKSGLERAEGVTAGVGTRSYASPEQINGSDYDASTDVFSLGIILFELCYPMSTVSFRSPFFFVSTFIIIGQLIFIIHCFVLRRY